VDIVVVAALASLQQVQHMAVLGLDTPHCTPSRPRSLPEGVESLMCG
jgi:hypothetical protein